MTYVQTDACRYINVITRQAKAVVLLHHMLGPTVMSFGTLITIFVINLRMCFFGSYFVHEFTYRVCFPTYRVTMMMAIRSKVKHFYW